jgi:hypothetical protein
VPGLFAPSHPGAGLSPRSPDLSGVHPGPPPLPPKPLGDDAMLRMLLPVGRSGWAIAAGYLGLFSLVILPAPLALFTGIMAVLDLRRNPKKHGWGRAIFGLVMGALGTIVLIPMLFALVLHK